MELNTVILSDVFDFLPEIPDESIDLAIIDPPYNLSKGEWDSFANDNEFYDFTWRYIKLLSNKIKSTGTVYFFNTAYNNAHILGSFLSCGFVFQNWITWYKKDGFCATKKKFVNNQESILFLTKSSNGYYFNAEEIREPYLSSERIKAAQTKGIIKNGKRWYPNPNGKLCTDVWEFPSVRLVNKINGKTTKQLHPTPKPEKMIERMIKASSKEGDVVLDLFSGTGTTSFVAKRLNRHYIGCENCVEYYNYIIKRLNYE